MTAILGTQESIITWAAVITAIGIIVAAFWYPIKVVYNVTRLWRGEPEIVDAHNKVIRKHVPGLPRMVQQMSEDLAEVRSQVKNSHSTNLRDDMDQLQTSLTHLDRKMSEHITISKQKDSEQEDTARKLDQHIEQTDQLMPMLKDLHTKWSPPDYK